jgi:Abortive infection alpha
VDQDSSTTHAVAEAVGKVASATEKALDVAQRAGAFFARVTGHDAVGIVNDAAYTYRAQRAIELQDQLDRIVEQRQIQGLKPLPIRLAIPFFQEATLVDDVDLQQRWAQLLANAMDPTFTGDIERCYIDILSGLSSYDASLLEKIIKDLESRSNHQYWLIEFLSERDRPKNAGESLDNLCRLGLIDKIPRGEKRPVMMKYWEHSAAIPTQLGKAFLRACSTSI